MYKSIIIKILFLSMCLCIVGCGKRSEIKTDCEENNFYTVEDLFAYSADSNNINVQIMEDNIVYASSGQSLMVYNQNEQNEKKLLDLQNEQSICGIGQDEKENILVITEKMVEGQCQYEWIETTLGGEQNREGKMENMSFFPKNIIKDDKDRWIVLSGEGVIYVYDDDRKNWQEIEREGVVETICLDVDGGVLIGERIDDTYYIVKLKENLKNEERKIVLNTTGTEANLFIGQEGERYFLDSDYLYCFDLGQETVEPVLQWIDVGLNGCYIKEISISQEDCILVATEQEGQCVIKKLTSVKKLKENRKELVLACVGLNSLLRERILEYNAESDDYKIVVRDYGQEEDPYQVLNIDIIAGKQFDIICMDGLYAQNYIEKGLLEDLTKYIDVDDYVHAYVEAIREDDGIYQVSPIFSVQTILGKTKDVGDNKGWTCDEMIKFLEDNQEKRGLLYYDEMDLMNCFIWSGMEGYLYQDSNGIHFEKDSFENMLEFVKNYQEYARKNERDTNVSATDMIYRDELSLYKAGISSGNDYRAYKAMFHSEITAKGYPMDNQIGNYMYLGMPIAICSKSQHKEASWEFISLFFTDEMQYEMKEYGFPVKRKILNQLYEEWCGKGEGREQELTITIMGKEEVVPYMNEEDVNELEAIIESSAKLCVDAPELIKIVREESELYFKGQQNLENTGNYIEKRINIYFEERS